MARQARRSGGLARLFLVVGVLTILGVTFGAGVYVGRVGAARPVSATAVEREAVRRGEPSAPRMSEPPRLTFYQELTAPLTAPPPPPRPVKSPASLERRSSESAPAATPASPSAPGALAAPASPAPSAPVGGRYTVQVGAYKARKPADELRDSLAAAGHDARVVESDGAGGVRYRVQVGDFASREVARELAARLSGPAFVTTR